MLLEPDKVAALDELPLVEADAAIHDELEVLKETMRAWRAYRAQRVAEALEALVDDGRGGQRPRRPVEVARELGVDPAVVGKLRDEHRARQAAPGP